MNGADETLLIEHGDTEWDQLDPAVRDRIESNPELLYAWYDNRSMRELMQLKRFELPDEAAVGRIAYGIRTRLENGTGADTGSASENVQAFAWLRYVFGGLAILALGLATLQVMQPGNLPGQGPEPVVTETVTESPFEFSATGTTNNINNLHPDLRLIDNREPLNFGPSE